MKKIYNKTLIEQNIKKYHIDQIFETLPKDFYLIEYETGETIINPLNRNEDFHFILEGIVHIYSIHSDGSMFTIAIQDNITLLGDMEFIDHDYPNYFVEAKTKVISLCLKMDENLKNDNHFLRYVLKSLTYKLKQSTGHQADFINLEDKLISYMKYNCDNHVLKHMEKSAMNLHCSRRQLQRVLSQLVDEGKIIKIKRGTYQLI